MQRIGLTALLAVATAGASACGGRDTDMDSVRRGDQAFAQGEYDEALAEYRLAAATADDDPMTLARVAHTYAIMEQVDDAGAYYARAAALDSAFTDQAVTDLMRLAREARARSDRLAMATAVETALVLRPGIGVSDMSLDLARHYFGSGQYGRALPFFHQALAETTESMPDVVFEVGRAHEEIGDCSHGLVFFERFRGMVRPWQRGEVDWYIGTCTLNLARDIRSEPIVDTGDLERALTLVNRALEVGEPRNLMALAWFEKGEILSMTGDCSGAMDAYAQVRYADNAGAFMERAQQRFDEIRFGRGRESEFGSIPPPEVGGSLESEVVNCR